ncbi:MAG: hypothetical protein JRF35_04515 [Deltaproteobacteria bacterium]|nr:hypothetical protein [Deltaproteobacteria bacterium]
MIGCWALESVAVPLLWSAALSFVEFTSSPHDLLREVAGENQWGRENIRSYFFMVPVRGYANTC